MVGGGGTTPAPVAIGGHKKRYEEGSSDRGSETEARRRRRLRGYDRQGKRQVGGRAAARSTNDALPPRRRARTIHCGVPRHEREAGLNEVAPAQVYGETARREGYVGVDGAAPPALRPSDGDVREHSGATPEQTVTRQTRSRAPNSAKSPRSTPP